MVALKNSLVTIEDCFTLYHTKGMACECDGDNNKVIFRNEK